MKPAGCDKLFAHRDMTMEEYGLYTFAREVSYGSGIFYGSGPGIAERFSGEGKNPVYRVAKNLVRKGWFQVVKKSRRDKRTGIYRPAEYRPLSPEEWAAKYPKKAERYTHESVPGTGNGTVPQTGNGTVASVPRIVIGRSRNRDRPFPESVRTVPGTGNKSDRGNLKEKNLKENNLMPTPPAPPSETTNPPAKAVRLTPNGKWSEDYLAAAEKAAAGKPVPRAELELAVSGMAYTHGPDESKWPPAARELARRLREGPQEAAAASAG